MAKLKQLLDGTSIKEYELDDNPLFIGRAAENAIQIEDSTVSGKHAVLTPIESPYLDGHLEYELEDLDSTNGTMINNKSIRKAVLHDGDLIKVGRQTLVFQQSEQANLDRTDIILPEELN